MIEALSLIALWCSVPSHMGFTDRGVDMCRAELVACVEPAFKLPTPKTVRVRSCGLT
jgi:hypothetical protein